MQEENCATVGDSELRHCLFQAEVKGSAITVLPEIQKEKELLVNATPPSVPLLQSSHELPDCVRAARKRQLPDSKCNSGIPPYGYLIMQIWLGGWMRSYQVCMHTSRTAQHKEAWPASMSIHRMLIDKHQHNSSWLPIFATSKMDCLICCHSVSLNAPFFFFNRNVAARP